MADMRHHSVAVEKMSHEYCGVNAVGQDAAPSVDGQPWSFVILLAHAESCACPQAHCKARVRALDFELEQRLVIECLTRGMGHQAPLRPLSQADDFAHVRGIRATCATSTRTSHAPLTIPEPLSTTKAWTSSSAMILKQVSRIRAKSAKESAR